MRRRVHTLERTRSLLGVIDIRPPVTSLNAPQHVDGIDVVRRLVASADVLVQNFRPGTMERLGLDEPTLRGINPRLVYVSISDLGETGPYAKKRVYDPVIQSLSGLADVQADQATGRPRMVRTIVADKTTAVHAAQAVCAALFARERSGQGQHVRLSMLDTMVAFIWPEAMTQYTVIGREGSGTNPTARPDLIYETQDSYITSARSRIPNGAVLRA